MKILMDSFAAERFWGAEELEREYGKIPEVFNFDVDKDKVEKRLQALLNEEVRLDNALEGLTPVETLWANLSLPYFTNKKERAKYDSFDEWYSRKTAKFIYLFQFLPYEDFVSLFYAAVKDLMCEKGTTTIIYEKLKQALKEQEKNSNCSLTIGEFCDSVGTIFYNEFKDCLFDYIENYEQVGQGPQGRYIHFGLFIPPKDLLFLIDNLFIFLKNTVFKTAGYSHFIWPCYTYWKDLYKNDNEEEV